MGSCSARPAGDILPGLYNNITPASPGGACFHSILQLPIIVANIIQILLALIAIIAVIMVIVSGIRYITSEGDPGRVSTAKAALRNAVIGVVLSASAYLIVDYIARQF
jgi:hypothetical protein